MTQRSRTLSLLVLIGLLALAAFGAWRWLGDTRPDASDLPTLEQQSAQPAVPVFTEPKTESAAPETNLAKDARAAAIADAGEPLPDYLEALSDTALTDDQVIVRLRESILDPALGQAEKVEVLTHLQNLAVSDPSKHLGPLARNPVLSPDLLSGMLDESLNRDFAWQAELALSVLETRREAELRETALRNLAFLAGEEHGDDIAAWKAAIRRASADWPTAN